MKGLTAEDISTLENVFSKEEKEIANNAIKDTIQLILSSPTATYHTALTGFTDLHLRENGIKLDHDKYFLFFNYSRIKLEEYCRINDIPYTKIILEEKNLLKRIISNIFSDALQKMCRKHVLYARTNENLTHELQQLKKNYYVTVEN